jgi:colanic acid/amylovoran biosynthesis glycosyltransferase
MSAERTVVIWRSTMISGSETFVRNQADTLTRWRPVYLGAEKFASDLSRDDDVIAFADRSSFLRLRLTGSSPRLRQVLAGTRPDLVHAHFGGDGWLISRAAQQVGVPLIVTVHGHDVTRQPAASGAHGLRYRRNLRAVFDRAALVIAVSGFIRDKAIECGADPEKVRVHHMGVPLPALPAVNAAAEKTWDVVFIGRFVEKKGAADLLTALAAMTTRPKALFIGSGPLETDLRTRAAQLGVDATFTGSLPPAEVRSRLAAAKLLAAPSRTAADGDTEGLPTTVVEALAMGVPVVATRHSGIPEAVVDGENGLLGAEGDTRALAANLTTLLGDDVLRSRMAAAARAYAEANFDMTRQTSLLEKIYDEVADRA